MNKLIGGDMKQRLVAQQQVEHDPGGGRAENDGTEHGSVQIASDLLEREEDGSNGSIECRRQSGRGANRDERPDPAGTEAQAASEYGGDSGAHLHGWAFAAERDAGGQRNGTETELAKHGPKADESVAKKKGRLGLRNAAAPGIGEIAGE